MNRTLPLPALAKIFADTAEIDSDYAAEIIRDFFAVISHTLSEGEQVRVKGLGTFSIGHDAENPVIFIPDREFAAQVNSPFEAFSPIEIPAGIDPATLTVAADASRSRQDIVSEPVSELDTKPEPDSEPETVQGPAPIIEPAPGPVSVEEEFVEEDIIEEEIVEERIVEEPAEESAEESKADIAETKDEPETEPETGSEHVIEQRAENKSEPESMALPEPKQEECSYADSDMHNDDDADEEQVYILPHRRRSVSSVVIISAATLLLGIIIGSVAAYFGHDKIVSAFSGRDSKTEQSQTATKPPTTTAKNINNGVSKASHTQTPPVSVTAEEKPETPPSAETRPKAKEPVYDTIGPRNFLTTMAGRHYGEKEFWVYIYDANASKLRHPDRIKPGTKILIPDYSTLPLTGDHKADVLAAKRHGSDIYARFK